MAELKTKKTKASVSKFLAGIKDEERRRDCRTVARLMKQATGWTPRMWGSAIVGFGDYRYRSPRTGRGGDWFYTGFSPRKGALTLYLMSGLPQYQSLLKRLGKHRTGVGCLYLNRLADVDLDVLRELIATATGDLKAGKTPGA